MYIFLFFKKLSLNKFTTWTLPWQHQQIAATFIPPLCPTSFCPWCLWPPDHGESWPCVEFGDPPNDKMIIQKKQRDSREKCCWPWWCYNVKLKTLGFFEGSPQLWRPHKILLDTKHQVEELLVRNQHVTFTTKNRTPNVSVEMSIFCAWHPSPTIATCLMATGVFDPVEGTASHTTWEFALNELKSQNVARHQLWRSWNRLWILTAYIYIYIYIYTHIYL